MQNEKYFYGYCNEFEYNHDYVKLMKYSYIYISMYTKYKYMYMCESMYNKNNYMYMCESIFQERW